MNKNGRKTFLKIHLQKRIIATLLLLIFLLSQTVSVFAASTLEEELPTSNNSTLNIDDDDFANGNLLVDLFYNLNDWGYSFWPVIGLPFTNGIVDIREYEIGKSTNGNIDMGKNFQDGFFFELADKTKMFSKGSNIKVSVSNFVNAIYFHGSDGSVIEKVFNSSAVNSVGLYLYDINGTRKFISVQDFSISSNHNILNFSFSFENVPFDVYQMQFYLTYQPDEAYSNSTSYFDNASYYFIRDIGFNKGKINFSELEHSATDEMLGAINDNLDDIWARLVAIYDMVEQGFSAIVTLFYDLMDFLSGEFDDLIQTIINQATETRNTITTQFTNLTNKLSTWFTNLTNTITTQFTNLTNKLSTWFTNLTNTITTQFSNLTTKLQSWYNGFTSTINTNFQNLLNQNKEEHEETINGYDDTVGANKNQEVSGSINDFNSSQGEIMDDMNQNMDDFTLPSNGLIGYAVQFTTTFPLVASMMQSVFDSSGQFGIILSVIFAMTIFAMVIGLYKYYND